MSATMPSLSRHSRTSEGVPRIPGLAIRGGRAAVVRRAAGDPGAPAPSRGAARPPACRLCAAEPGDDAVPELAVAGAAELGGPLLCIGERAGGRLGARAGLAALGRRSVAVNIAVAVAAVRRHRRARRRRPPSSRPSTIRCIGCAAGGSWARRSRALLASHPGLTLLADDRELLAALIYYVRPHPFGAVEWNPIPGITDQYRLDQQYRRSSRRRFSRRHGARPVRRDAPGIRRADPADDDPHRHRPNGGTTYTVSIARGYSGDGRRTRRR